MANRREWSFLIALKRLAPILTTDDMDRSVRFYVEVLGFTCGMQAPGYSNLYRDAARIMLAAPNKHLERKGPNFTGQLYIDLETAEEVDALWEKVKDRAEVIYAVEGPRVTDWLAKGVRKQHRTLGTTLNTLIDAGFAIRRVEEWSPTLEQVAAQPSLAEELDRPMMALVAAQK